MKNERLTEESKTKWLSVTKNEYISSEESGEDDSIAVRPLPWRTSYVTTMFQKIDSYCQAHKSAQARSQMKARVMGEPSSRPMPIEYPAWAKNTD